MDTLPQRRPVEIRLPNVDLVAKLSVIGAALVAIREAHRDDMGPKSWAALNRAEDAIAEAIVARNEGRLIRGS